MSPNVKSYPQTPGFEAELWNLVVNYRNLLPQDVKALPAPAEPRKPGGQGDVVVPKRQVAKPPFPQSLLGLRSSLREGDLGAAPRDRKAAGQGVCILLTHSYASELLPGERVGAKKGLRPELQSSSVQTGTWQWERLCQFQF